MNAVIVDIFRFGKLGPLLRHFNYETQLLLVYLDLGNDGLCYVTSLMNAVIVDIFRFGKLEPLLRHFNYESHLLLVFLI